MTLTGKPIALDVARSSHPKKGRGVYGPSTLEKAMALRQNGIPAPVLLLGERQGRVEWCVAHDLTVCVDEPHTISTGGITTLFNKRSRPFENQHRHEPLRRAMG